MERIGMYPRDGSVLKKGCVMQSISFHISTPKSEASKLGSILLSRLNNIYFTIIPNMHHRPPSPSGFIEPLTTTARAPDARSIYQTDLTTATSRLERPNEEFKYTPGIWSSGGSTAVSVSGNQTEDNTFRSTISRHFRADIDTTHTDIPLIICGFVGGLVDGLSFNAWGSFSSMQTGMWSL
jgi:hypothetical protein